MPIVKVPKNIADEGRRRAGGKFQDEQYGTDMRVVTTSKKGDGKVCRDTVTGKEFTK